MALPYGHSTRQKKRRWAAMVRRNKRRRMRGRYTGAKTPIKRMRAISRNARIGGFLGIELKFLDCAWNSVALATSTDGAGGELNPSSGCTLAISVPAQGNGQSERDGQKYQLKSAWVSGNITTAAASDQDDVAEIPGYFIALVQNVRK